MRCSTHRNCLTKLTNAHLLIPIDVRTRSSDMHTSGSPKSTTVRGLTQLTTPRAGEGKQTGNASTSSMHQSKYHRAPDHNRLLNNGMLTGLFLEHCQERMTRVSCKPQPPQCNKRATTRLAVHNIVTPAKRNRSNNMYRQSMGWYCVRVSNRKCHALEQKPMPLA